MMRTMVTALALFTASPQAAASAAEQSPIRLETEEHRIVYTLGRGLGKLAERYHLKAEEVPVLAAGLQDHLLGEPSLVKDLEKHRAKAGYFITQRRIEAGEAEKAAARDAERAFLEEMAERPGADVRVSGLVYIEAQAGSGSSPSPSDTVRVHYHGTLRDGSVFDSSLERGRPATFALDSVIKCWREGLPMMSEGGKGTLVCPSELAYGDRGAPPRIPGGATLAFEVELLEVVEKAGD